MYQFGSCRPGLENLGAWGYTQGKMLLLLTPVDPLTEWARLDVAPLKHCLPISRSIKAPEGHNVGGKLALCFLPSKLGKHFVLPGYLHPNCFHWCQIHVKP